MAAGLSKGVHKALNDAKIIRLRDVGGNFCYFTGKEFEKRKEIKYENGKSPELNKVYSNIYRIFPNCKETRTALATGAVLYYNKI